MRVAGLIPAAGSGTRLGLGPKALVQLAGRSLLERALHGLRPHVDELLVALPAGLELPDLKLPLPGVRTITGGSTRQDSVRLLLEASDAGLVLIHDAARPFLPPGVARAALEAASEVGAATAALPVADTLVRAEAGNWGERVEREGLWAVQTPQGFRREGLLEAHHWAQREGHTASDDAGLLRWAGGRVALVPGDSRLFKVTTPSDLELAEALAAVWDRVPGPE